MSTATPSPWSSHYRLVAAEKWKAKSAAMGSAVTQALVEYSCPLPGMAVLDLASGTGEPAITLAERVGSQGSVAAVDQSAELLEIAAERARRKKLTNLATHQADAHALPFPDRAFDLATCRHGVMFFADPTRALSELRRVLKPGGRACFVAWGPAEQPYWQTTMKIVHRHVGGTMLPAGGADPFPLFGAWLAGRGSARFGLSRGGRENLQPALDMARRRGRSFRVRMRGRCSFPADARTRSGRDVAYNPRRGQSCD